MNSTQTPITVSVAWGKETKGTVSIVNSMAGDDELRLDHADKGDLTLDTFRRKFIKAVADKRYAVGETSDARSVLEKHLEIKLMERLEERQADLKKQAGPASTKGPYTPPNKMDTLNDIGNADRLVYYFGHSLRWCDTWNCWMVYDGRTWAKDNTRYIEACAKQAANLIYNEVASQIGQDAQNRMANHAKSSRSHHSLCNMVAQAKSSLAITPEQFDAHNYLLTVESGVLNLQNGQHLPFDPTMYLTKMANVVFNPEAQCPRFIQFMEQITCNRPELADYLQRFLGMCMTGDIRYQALPILYGKGCNGKSTLIDLFRAIMGEYVLVAPESLITSRQHDEHPTELASLQGTRLAVANETDEGKKIKLALVKRLTGDDTVTARFMRGDFFTFNRTNKTIIVTNNKPRLTEIDDAVRGQRIKLIPFEFNAKTAGVEDANLKEKLLAEKSGILNWLMEGCRKFMASGMTDPACIRVASDAYFLEEDVLTDFVNETCMIGPSLSTPVVALYLAYTAWATLNGNKFPLGQRTFGQRMVAKFGESQAVRFGGIPTKCYKGVGLRSGVSL